MTVHAKILLKIKAISKIFKFSKGVIRSSGLMKMSEGDLTLEFEDQVVIHV